MQQYPILATKLYSPPVRSEWVSRPRLVARLQDSVGSSAAFARKLTLISAPAGFGKTTLVTEWLETLKEASPKVCVAWLSLDEGDNDLNRFLHYLIAAMLQCQPFDSSFGSDALNMLQSPQPHWESVLTSLINELMLIDQQLVFVFDDYHMIHDDQVHNVLSFLMQHQPPQLHLVISTRQDPPFQLARMRARRMMMELRAIDLRFTSPEISAFLSHVLNISLTQADINALEQRTEGWIAGLQLAALSMRNAKDVSAFVQSFTGSHRFVLDYLIEEVLLQQPEAVQTFLLQTSILDRMTGALCDALTGQHNGHETLTSLEHANLFLIPLDQERRWYRYHHLFADLLHQRLRMLQPDTVPALHRKAAVWYETAGFRDEAIQHALSGDDIPTAIRLMEAGSEDALERSEFNFIFKCVSQLPEHALSRAPWLYIYHCWALILIGHIEETNSRLANSGWLTEAVADNPDQLHLMQGYIAALQEQLYGWKRDYETMRKYNDQAIAIMPEDSWVTAYCYMGKGVDAWAQGDLEAATDVFAKAYNIGNKTGNARVIITGSGYLVHSLEIQGHLTQSINLSEKVIARFTSGSRSLPVTVYAHVDIGRVLIERNELDLAAEHIITGINYSLLLDDTRVGKLAHYLMARIQIARGEYDAALTSITTGDALHSGTELTVDMRGTDYPQVRLWLAQGKLSELKLWLQSCDLDVKTIDHFKTRLIFTMHARVMLALHQTNPDSGYLTNAQDLLEILYENAQSRGWWSRVIEIMALQALVLDALESRDKALSILKRALDMAATENYIRTFVDEGAAMARLLYEALSRDIHPVYVQRLLAAYPDAPVTSPEPQLVAADSLIEPLSDREIDVLQLIAEGLTNPEIAQKLYVSLNTIKAHTRNIYGKLGVNNRTQAANRAKALGLIS